MSRPHPTLFHRRLAEGPGRPLVILHGLLGSSRNWATFGKAMEGVSPVFGLDLRNHGESFHDDEMSYAAMVADVLHWCEQEGFVEVDLLGHSMGGKVAMCLACRHSERVRRLVVADIAPVAYEPHYRRVIEVMGAMDLSKLASRRDAEEALEPYAPDPAFRQFLLTNLEKTPDGFQWKVNFPVVLREHAHLADNPVESHEVYNGPALLVCGDRSSFVRPKGVEAFRTHFPNGRVIAIPAGHNLHIEAADRFLAEVGAFLKED